MAEIVVTGASAVCSFGTAPGTVCGGSQAACMVGGKPAATIQDAQPSSITPFGMCTSLAHPQVAAATAAAAETGDGAPSPAVCPTRQSMQEDLMSQKAQGEPGEQTMRNI